MKINKKPIEIKPRKPTFIEWVLGSPKAFSIVWRMAMIVPCVLFSVGAVFALSLHAAWYILAPTFIFTGLAFYNLWRNRTWFKTEPNIVLGKMVFGMQVELEPGDEGYEEQPKKIDEVN